MAETYARLKDTYGDNVEMVEDQEWAKEGWEW
jgi:hypothetical protein